MARKEARVLGARPAEEPKYVGGISFEDDGAHSCVVLLDANRGKFLDCSPLTSVKLEGNTYTRAFLETQARRFDKCNEHPLAAIGISCFGLIHSHQVSSTESATRKDSVISVSRFGWQCSDDTPIVFKTLVPEWAEIPVCVQHDCTTSAITEYYAQNDKDACPGFVFIHLGTGVGVGVLWRGKPRDGRIHPVMSHMPVIRYPNDPLKSTCKTHGGTPDGTLDCFQGLICEGAILARAGMENGSLHDIPAGNPVWDLVAWYLGQLCATITLTLGCDRIVIGGRAMRDREKQVREPLYAQIRAYFRQMVGAHPRYDKMEDTETYIQPAKVWNNPGLWGALELARLDAFPRIIR